MLYRYTAHNNVVRVSTFLCTELTRARAFSLFKTFDVRFIVNGTATIIELVLLRAVLRFPCRKFSSWIPEAQKRDAK